GRDAHHEEQKQNSGQYIKENLFSQGHGNISAKKVITNQQYTLNFTVIVLFNLLFFLLIVCFLFLVF
ncbi:MAG: hypothetical protein PHT11_09560, partial [Synergistaceae bacterium]|nr:hypothetical protein [Synergistaceae bacterium]MDD4613711.1 hypothetical protein [Synergistaceae bacterium]